MRITAAMSGWSWLAAHLRERGLTAAGITSATVRMSMDQLAGQVAGRLGHDVTSLLDHVQADRLHLVDCILGALAIAGTIVGGRPDGPVGTVVTLMVPVGGPVWAGLLPASTTYKGLRSAFRLLGRVGAGSRGTVLPMLAGIVPLASARVVPTPATCNARRPSTCEAGRVSLSVLIVDDSAPFREVARRLLERQGLEVVGTAATLSEAIAQVEALHPKIALVDINLAGESGFEVTRQLTRSDRTAGTAVILTSTHAESEYADLLAGSPAVGFVAKERLSAEAIRAALSRGTR